MRTLLLPPPLTAGVHDLDEDEAHHARTVLRVAVGDAVRLADAAGMAAAGTVAAVERGRVAVRCGDPTPVPDTPAAALAIAAAPPKGDRLADLVRALSELGVGTYIPLICVRGTRDRWNGERLRRVALESLKQCRRGKLLDITAPMTVDEVISAAKAEGRALAVCDPAGEPARPGPPTATTVVIGPEGGLTADEAIRLRKASAVAVRLGGAILRIETAATAAAAVWAAAWESPR